MSFLSDSMNVFGFLVTFRSIFKLKIVVRVVDAHFFRKSNLIRTSNWSTHPVSFLALKITLILILSCVMPSKLHKWPTPSPQVNFLWIFFATSLKLPRIFAEISTVEAIMRKCQKEQLIQIYKLTDFNNSMEFLIQIANKRGKFKKGGAPNIFQAAKCVLQGTEFDPSRRLFLFPPWCCSLTGHWHVTDWNEGKIKFYTIPPVLKNVHISAEIVQKYGKEFSFNDVVDNEQDTIAKFISKHDYTRKAKFMPMVKFLRNFSEKSEKILMTSSGIEWTAGHRVRSRCWRYWVRRGWRRGRRRRGEGSIPPADSFLYLDIDDFSGGRRIFHGGRWRGGRRRGRRRGRGEGSIPPTDFFAILLIHFRTAKRWTRKTTMKRKTKRRSVF